MNALSLKEILTQYSNKELKNMKVKVRCDNDYENNDIVPVEDFESTDTELVLNI